jgi:hypothetical protein
MMTMAAIPFGLLPIMWSDGSGSEVMKRVIGGLMTALKDPGEAIGKMLARLRGWADPQPAESIMKRTRPTATGSLNASPTMLH